MERKKERKINFLKQKTAYEMRISDWSSDVCSSDLTALRSAREAPGAAAKARRLSEALPPTNNAGRLPHSKTEAHAATRRDRSIAAAPRRPRCGRPTAWRQAPLPEAARSARPHIDSAGQGSIRPCP